MWKFFIYGAIAFYSFKSNYKPKVPSITDYLAFFLASPFSVNQPLKIVVRRSEKVTKNSFKVLF